ncbi:hypothetical protein TL16_g12705 [Triparma laevis f. inornata]|uniref:Uncharacterized protein n=1 Tax=Triparma laevis f. inornata TaxID=1714386 RepID=A0A9W7EXR9_9STRA|nr:hypothetical protein TL16_g12705 [Triparma laevis f. inornata]
MSKWFLNIPSSSTKFNKNAPPKLSPRCTIPSIKRAHIHRRCFLIIGVARVGGAGGEAAEVGGGDGVEDAVVVPRVILGGRGGGC